MERLMKSKAGFTLIELIIVIIILGVLAAVATPAVFSWVANSRVSTVKTDIATVEGIAKQLYMSDPATFNAKTVMDTITKTSKAVWTANQGDNTSGTAMSAYLQTKITTKKLSEMNLVVTGYTPSTGVMVLEVVLPSAKVVGDNFTAAPGYSITNEGANTPGQVTYTFNVN